jgi:hypothetical protein
MNPTPPSRSKQLRSNDNGHFRDPIDVVLDALRAHQCNPREHRGQWKALCPAHNDHNPSLSIKRGDDGTVLVNCRSHRCTFEAIASALGLEKKDFFPRMWSARKPGRKPKSKPIEFKDDDDFLDSLKVWSFVFPTGPYCKQALEKTDRELNVSPYGAAENQLTKWTDSKVVVVELPGWEDRAEPTARTILDRGAAEVFLWRLESESWDAFSLKLVRFVEPWTDNGETVRKIEPTPPQANEAANDPHRLARLFLKEGFDRRMM